MQTSSQINQGIVRKRKTETVKLIDTTAIDNIDFKDLDTIKDKEAISPANIIDGNGPTNIKESYVDPQLWANAENISCVITNSDNIEPNKDTTEAIFNQIEASLELPLEFIIPGIEFVTFLSQINVIRNDKIG